MLLLSLYVAVVHMLFTFAVKNNKTTTATIIQMVKKGKWKQETPTHSLVLVVGSLLFCFFLIRAICLSGGSGISYEFNVDRNHMHASTFMPTLVLFLREFILRVKDTTHFTHTNIEIEWSQQFKCVGQNSDNFTISWTLNY